MGIGFKRENILDLLSFAKAETTDFLRVGTITPIGDHTHTSTLSGTDTYTHACTYRGYSNTHTHVYRLTCALPITHGNHVPCDIIGRFNKCLVSVCVWTETT